MVAIPGTIEAVIFDMDGVVTDTASVHQAAWKRSFDEFLLAHSRRTGVPFEPFTADDYRQYVDGMPRYDGVRRFLASRGITLPEGQPSDPPGNDTICAVGNAKNGRFLDALHETGARPYGTTVALVDRLSSMGVRTAVISSSRNMTDVLASADLADRFDARVDGATAASLELPGKPDPAVFLEAARRVDVPPDRAAVVEDALAGVEAGKRGGFALVIGVDRTGHPEALRRAGADAVVADLEEVDVAPQPSRRLDSLPTATAHEAEIRAWLGDRRPAVYLDYDGTLTPIVDDPAKATLPPAMRDVLERLAAVCPVAIVSGRDLADVRSMVGIGGLWYAGSHGFDIAGPHGERHERAPGSLEALDAAEAELRAPVEAIEGARVERKRFAIAVHFRQVPERRVPEVDRIVQRVAAAHEDLRRTGGKMIHELRPAVEWDKGRAVHWLERVLGLDGPEIAPIFVGDDETDEDAIRALGHRGLGLVVRGEADDRPSLARFALDGPDDVRRFLGLVADWAEAVAAAAPPATSRDERMDRSP